MFKLKLVELDFFNIIPMFVKIFNFCGIFFGAKFIFYPINTEFDQKLKFIPDFNRISSVFSKFIKFKTEIRLKLFARF
jgi:hypothetical protein